MFAFLSVPVNYWAILGAGIASMVVGAIWYSQSVFGKRWMQLSGMSDMDKKGAGRGYLITFIGALVMAYVLAHFVYYLNVTAWQYGLQLGFWVWLGFVGTVTLNDYVWGKKNNEELYFITNGHYLLSLLVMGSILAGWR